MKLGLWIALAAGLFVAFFVGSPEAVMAQGTDPPAVVQETTAPGKTATELADFRNLIMIAFGFVFAAIIGYLVISHRKNAGLAEEVAFLKGRVDALRE